MGHILKVPETILASWDYLQDKVIEARIPFRGFSMLRSNHDEVVGLSITRDRFSPNSIINILTICKIYSTYIASLRRRLLTINQV